MKSIARIVAVALAFGALPRAARAMDPIPDVDPFLGTGGHGHTFPGATLPFGMVQLSPDTRLTGWDGCSGYHDSDSRIYGFSHTHLSGTGARDYGDILLVPGVGAIRWTNGSERPDSSGGYASRFRKVTEKASPGYYAVTLDDPGVDVELTATLRTGMHRYTYPASDSAFVLVDLTHRDEVIESSLTVVSDTEIEGLRRSSHWADNQRVYFVARFSKPFRALVAVDDVPQPELKQASGKNVKAALRFQTTAHERVMVKVGISAVDAAGARANLDAENPAWDFDAVQHAAREAWRAALARVEIEGASRDKRTAFYTALYHTMIQPNLYTDVDGRYRGRDDAIHHADDGHVQYTVFSLWDTFRAAHPLYTILEPKRTVDFIKTFLAQYQEGGHLPVWELGACETMCMIGYHAVPVIVDAWAKGIRDFDTAKALEAMKASANADQLGLPAYRERGYVPGDVESEDVSKTLEYAYDDWCISRFAAGIGQTEDARVFARRAQGWRHLLDPETHFMRPRLNATFKTPFDPTEVDVHYTEANAWQYSFFVPQDVPGQMAAMGGAKAYVALLDSLFTAPSAVKGRDLPDVAGLVGQYAHGNEPSHHIAYLYDLAGEPWKTQARVRQLVDTMYSDKRDGLAGNEDCGQMSAWYVLSTLGFYSATPGEDYYVIGSPVFRRAALHLDGGKVFTITTRGDGPYVQSAKLNGTPLDRCFIHHNEITAGGALAFEMGTKPNRSWGVGAGKTPSTEAPVEVVTAAPYVSAGDMRFHGKTSVSLACLVPGASIHYTVNGAAPTDASPLFTSPIEVDSTSTIRFFAAAQGSVPSPPQEATFREIPGNRRVVSCTPPPSTQYSAGGVDALIDGVRGGDDYRLGAWLGFQGVSVDFVVDLGKIAPVHRLTVEALQDQESWIFMPPGVIFEVSQDGRNWVPAGIARNDVDLHKKGVVRRDFTWSASPRTTRFVRIHVESVKRCPDWHPSAGEPSWIFVDEFTAE